MAFRLHPSCPIQDEVRRVSCELIDDARAQLSVGDVEANCGIHNVRKDFKKIRSLLRLARSSFVGSYEFENQCFRDLGRELASRRDSEAMVEAFDSLAEGGLSELSPDLVRRTREFLLQRRDEQTAEEGSFEEKRAEILSVLARARARAEGWSLHDEGFAALEKGLLRGLRTARRAGREVQRSPSSQTIHEWRKRSKIHWHHMRLLADVCGEESEAWRTGLDRLNDVLGDHQDLELLIELADSGIPHYTRHQSELLRQLLRRRQDRLRDEAAHLGAPYLVEKPRALLAHVRHAWERASETA